jgi:hypothetical protein
VREERMTLEELLDAFGERLERCAIPRVSWPLEPPF